MGVPYKTLFIETNNFIVVLDSEVNMVDSGVLKYFPKAIQKSQDTSNF